MTNEEIIQRGILIRDETEPAQNTSTRVGGVIEGIGENLVEKDTDIAAEAARNGYYQCTVSGTELAVTAPGFTLPAHGGNIRIKMSAPATGACTLNINSTGAKQLLYNGAAVSSANTWEQNEIISVFYDPSGSGQYLASNSQGGGGKSEKIKYDNSQSGLAAENVQGAIDESIINSLNRGFSSENITLGASIGFFIAPNSKIWSSSSSSHYIIAIKPYDTFKIIANANSVSDFAFLKRNDYPVNNENAPISDIDNIVHRIEAGGYRYATAPADAKFLYVWGTHSGVVHDPQQIIKYVDDSERDDIVDGIYDAVYNFESVTGLTEGNGFVILSTASYTNVTNSNYKHKYVAREQSWKRLKVKANNTTRSMFFFVTSNPTPSNQLPLPLCSGTYANIVDVGMTKEFYIPDDCAFIIFDTKAGSADYTPDIIEVNGESVGNLLSEETPIDLSEYDEILGWISQTGDYLGTAGSGHYVIDVRGYDKFIGIANATNASYFVRASAVNGNSWTKYGGREDPAANTSFEFKTFGQPYLIVGNYSSQGNRDIANSVLPQSLSLVSNDRIGTLEERVSKLEDGGIGKTDIVSLNGKLELDTMFRAATRAERTVTSNGITIETSTLVFLHFSDLHGNESNLVRIVSLYNAYSEYVDDVINTGDNITNTFNDSFAFYGTHGAGGFLNVIGNHDAQKGSNSYATEAELYAKFISPFISQWGVTSYTENKCYYYKDYTDRNLRLIVLDAYNVNWNGNNAQITWLEGVLADAITNELHVMIAVHSGLCRKSDLECNFNSMQARWNWLGSNDNVVTWQGQVDGYLGSVVDTFIQNGGKFICWLSGHTHCDVMGFGARHPNQMTINIGSSGNMELVNRASDIERVEGTKTQDCVNMVVIDTFKKQLKLYRIGGDIDRYFRSRKALVYDYENREVIYQR